MVLSVMIAHVKPAQAEGNVKPITNETSILPYNFAAGNASCIKRYAGGYGASSETWSVNPGSVFMQPPWWGAQCRATLCYYYCNASGCYNPCYFYPAIGNPDSQPLCPATFQYYRSSNTCKANSCPAHATGSGTTCICDTGYRPDPSATFCLPDKLFIRLEGGKTTEPATSLPFKAIVTDYAGKPAAAGVTLSVEVEPRTGGHDHHDPNRPKGSVPGSGATGADGVWDFAFTATEVAGTHTITAKCDRCDSPATARVDVKVEGLVPISGSPLYSLQLPNRDTNHPNAHFLTPSSLSKLEMVASLYYSYTYYKSKNGVIPDLVLNDASLEWGGVLDCFLTCANSQPWGPAHKEHRRGSVVDIKANGEGGSVVYEEEFKNIAKAMKIKIGQPHGTGNGRHYHVRLNGIAE